MTPAPSPVTPADAVELRLARSAALFLVVLGVPVIAVAGLLAGWPGAASAAIGTAVVIGMFLMAGALMSWAARISPAALMGAVLGGYLIRLMIYAGLIVLLRPVPWLSGPSLAISTAVLLVAVLAWEVRVASRNPSMFWVDARADRAASPAVVYTRGSDDSGQFSSGSQARSARPVVHGERRSRELEESLTPPVERTRP